mgnify:FL=1
MGENEEKLNSILGDQQAMGQIMALAQSLGKQSSSDQEEKDTAPEPAEDAPPDLSQLMGNLDPKMVQLGMRLMREYQQDDGQNTALLQALRPYLREERRGRLDKAVQIAKMSRLLRVALGSLGGKGEDTLV